MSYLPYLDDEEQKKQQGQNAQPNISGTSNVLDQGAQSVAPTAPKPVGRSGSWTNINSYLDANKDNAQSMGNQIADSVSKQATDAETKIGYLGAEKQQVVAEVDTDKYLSNPLDNDENKIKDYAKLKTTGGYEGPSNVSGTKYYNEALNATNQASAKVKNAASEEGRMNLLADQYNRPTYSKGSKILDNALLQGNTQAKETLNQVNQRFSGLNSMFDSAQLQVSDSIAKANTQALDNKKKIIQDEANAWNNLVNPIKQRAKDLTASNMNRINQVKSDLSDDSLSEDTLNLLGISDGQKLYDQKLMNYLTPDQTQVGVNNAANADERARYLALQKLINDPTRSEITADGKAINPLTFNKEQFMKDNLAKQQELDDIFKNTNLSNEYGFGHNEGYISSNANANVADYLSRGDSAITTDWNWKRGETLGASDYTTQGRVDAQNGAKWRLVPQLENFLKQQNYYRAIKKV